MILEIYYVDGACLRLSPLAFPITWFHRPLSDYWKAFKRAGFLVDDFEEPHLTPDRNYMAEDPRRLRNATTRPYSVAFRLVKQG